MSCSETMLPTSSSSTLPMTTTNIVDFPDRVLCCIFKFFCEDEPVCLPMQTTDRRVVLSLVDGAWNVVLHSTPTLWTDIFFPSPSSHNVLPDDLLDEFTMCTIVSGNNNLDIAFDMGHHDWPFSIVHAIILPNIRRIRRLTCPIQTNDDIISFLTISEGRFSTLESINVGFIDTWTTPASHFPLDVCLGFKALHTAPRLRECTAHLFNGLHPIDLHLPWAQLTFLDLGSMAMPPEILVKIMRFGSSHLQSGFFHVRFSSLLNPQRILSYEKITMHSLQRLRLRVTYPSNDRRLFSILQFPALRSLWVEAFDIDQAWDVSIYTTLLRASSNTLQQLCLSDFSPPGLRIFQTTQNVQGYPARRIFRKTTHDALDKLFAVIPNVKNLYLPLGLPIHVITAEKLASCNILPQLRMLEFGATIESAQHMLSVVEKRYKHVSNAALGMGNSRIISQSASEPQLAVIRHLSVLVPSHRYMHVEELALNQQRRSLASLGITVHVHPTNALPLPLR